jgi:hypothetical protein
LLKPSELASGIQSKIAKYCKEKNIYQNKIMQMSRSGMPDILVVYNGVTYYFEIKAKGDRLSDIQKAVISILNKDKEIAYVVKSFDEFKKIWEEKLETA